MTAVGIYAKFLVHATRASGLLGNPSLPDASIGYKVLINADIFMNDACDDSSLSMHGICGKLVGYSGPHRGLPSLFLHTWCFSAEPLILTYEHIINEYGMRISVTESHRPFILTLYEFMTDEEEVTQRIAECRRRDTIPAAREFEHRFCASFAELEDVEGVIRRGEAEELVKVFETEAARDDVNFTEPNSKEWIESHTKEVLSLFESAQCDEFFRAIKIFHVPL